MFVRCFRLLGCTQNREPVPLKQVGVAHCLLLSSGIGTYTPSRVLSAHLPPRSPTQSLPTGACVSSTRSFRPTSSFSCSHARSGASIVDGLTCFSFVTCQACEKPDACCCSFAPRVSCYPQIKVAETRCAAARSCFECDSPHRVSRFHQSDDASQYLVFTRVICTSGTRLSPCRDRRRLECIPDQR